MKVLNFGSLNYDYVYKVDHMVRPGETMNSLGMEIFLGGKGLNQSMALARAGVFVFHAGMVGEDGGRFLEACKESGVDTRFVRRISGQSGHAIIQLDGDSQNSILLYGGANRCITKEFVDEVLSEFGAGDILLLQNEINELAYIIDAAYEKNMQIVLNPSPLDAELEKCDLRKVSVFLMNEIEGEALAGSVKDPEEILNTMAARYPDARLVLTLGAEGVRYRDKNGTVVHPCYPVKAVDTTAAGDTFTGYFVASMLKNLSAEETLDICTKASAIAVSRMGAVASIPTMEEVRTFIF